MTLPRILAGPALRRTDSRGMWIWLCTSEQVELNADVFSLADDGSLCEIISDSAASHSVQLGAALFVHMIQLVPRYDRFDHTTVLGYHLYEGSGGVREALRDFDEAAYGVGSYSFPTFVIQNHGSNALRALFCSCRKLHGPGIDASAGMMSYLVDHLLDGEFGRPRHRPTALLLLGDQIYADDVSAALFPLIYDLARELRPSEGTDPMYAPSLVNSRQNLMYAEAGLTSTEAANHLITLGEFAAMYLMSWNELTWPPLDVFRPTGPGEPAPALGDFADAWQGSSAWRRLLANCPSYMMFDDHDVTDDWNINPSWYRHVMGRGGSAGKPLGKKILANALVAYWAFQGWGNNPDAFDAGFIAAIQAYAAIAPTDITDEQVDAILARLTGNRTTDVWSYTTPTKPVAVFLDFRNHRIASTNVEVRDSWVYVQEFHSRLLEGTEGFDSIVRNSGRRIRGVDINPLMGSNHLNGMAPRFIDAVLRAKAVELLGGLRDQPMLLVTGTPIIGSNLIDFGQETAIAVNHGAFAWDFENWRADPENLLDLYGLLHDARPSVCAVLSGDVHFASFLTGRITWPDGSEIKMGQFTSSSLKNESFPDEIIMRLGEMLLEDSYLVQRWLYEPPEPPSSRDGSGPTARLMFESEAIRSGFDARGDIGRFGAAYRLSAYCDEHWQLRDMSSGTLVTHTNFGSLVATNDSAQLFVVQLHSWTGEEIGNVVRLGRA